MANNTLLIVEPRYDLFLLKVIKQFIQTTGWLHLVFYCGNGLKDTWTKKFNEYQIHGKIIELPDKNLNAYTYSDLLKSRHVWESIETEYVLVFQLDTWTDKKYSKTYDLNYFIDKSYSYIGGNMSYPWYELKCNGINFKRNNFNGGLSLRRTKHMLDIIDNFPPQNTMDEKYDMTKMAEDCYFTLGCIKLGYKVGNDEESSHFAVHTIPTNDFFGIHKLDLRTLKQMCTTYPELLDTKCF